MASSPDEQKNVGSNIDPVSASNDARVTAGQVRDSFCTLARQIAALTGAGSRNAGRRAKVWWSGWRAVRLETAASFRSRWPGLKADLLSLARNARWPSLNLKSGLERWQNKSGPSAPKWRSGLHRPKSVMAKPGKPNKKCAGLQCLDSVAAVRSKLPGTAKRLANTIRSGRSAGADACCIAKLTH